MKYFNNIQTLEELKKEYHKWAARLHPDAGGSDEAMKALNSEYTELFKCVKNIHTNKEGEHYTKETAETPDEFQNLIKELLKLNNICIEIIGCFVWVTGDTKPHKEILKQLGMKWHHQKMCWYLSPAGYRRFGGEEYSMEKIRSMYGVEYAEEVRLKEIQAV